MFVKLLNSLSISGVNLPVKMFWHSLPGYSTDPSAQTETY